MTNFEYLDCPVQNFINELKTLNYQYLNNRLCSWFGPVPYIFSSFTFQKQTVLPPLLQKTLDFVRGMGYNFNSVLVNCYRRGPDHVGWHADDEEIIVPRAPILSISLGASRLFEIKVPDSNNVLYSLPLAHGAILIMGGNFQHEFFHRVKRDPLVTDVRFNLTFRLCKTSGPS